jgi:cation/acetate symporter
VGQVVAYAFGLAASSSFPVIVLGIFWRGTTAAVAEPAVARSERTI